MIKPHYFNLSILFFTGLVLVLIIFILIKMYIRNKRGRKLQKWKLMVNLLIRKAIFFENDDQSGTTIPVTTRTHQLLHTDIHFKKMLTDEMVNAKKNVSGSSANHLKQLYLQLNLQDDALARLKSLKWYIKAQAIQELAVMDMAEHVAQIYRLTNNANELVRMEAQIAVVKLLGFEGLRFLDVVTYPITEWQQIRLLHELLHTPTENFNGIENWLKSDNKTVVIFALKLASTYHRFELYDAISPCLTDDDARVRLHTINTLGELYNDSTSALLTGRFLKEDLKLQIAIVKVLKNIATEDDIPALLDELNTDNAELKLIIAKALANIGPQGMDALQQHQQASEYPLTEIITQIKSEVVT